MFKISQRDMQRQSINAYVRDQVREKMPHSLAELQRVAADAGMSPARARDFAMGDIIRVTAVVSADNTDVGARLELELSF